MLRCGSFAAAAVLAAALLAACTPTRTQQVPGEYMDDLSTTRARIAQIDDPAARTWN